MTASSHLTAARIILTELTALLREPVNLKEAQMVAAAIERHLFDARLEAIEGQGYNAPMPVLRAIDTILLPAP